MLYNLTPAKELTGGPWYTELEFDHEFISELRTFLMHCVRRLNGGRGVTLAEIKEKMVQANVSRVQLSLEEVQQLMQTLAFDHLIEHSDVNEQGVTLFVAARRVTPMCEFKCKKPGFFVYHTCMQFLMHACTSLDVSQGGTYFLPIFTFAPFDLKMA